jgi:hypothetical protein
VSLSRHVPAIIGVSVVFAARDAAAFPAGEPWAGEGRPRG